MSKIINVDIKKFSYSNETILKDITFSVNKGEFIVITGLSGCGKTSLLRLLNGLVPALYDGNIIGQISILDKSISDYKAGEIAKYVGNVFQNPNDQFFQRMLKMKWLLSARIWEWNEICYADRFKILYRK